MALYENGQRLPGKVDLDRAYEACRNPECFAWIGLFEPTEDEFDSVRREFDLHELAVEDAINAHQRPKLEVYDDTLFVVLKTARYVDELDEVELGEIQLFVGDGFIVTVRHGETELHDVRLELERRPGLLRLGPRPPCTRSSTRSSTTTAPSSPRWSTTSARSRPTCSPRIGRLPRSGSTG